MHTRRDAAVAGVLYLLLVLVAPIRLVYIQNTLLHGDAAAIMAAVAAHPALFRIGILSDLFCATLEVFLTLSLYRLFSPYDRPTAALMAVLGLMPVPLYFINVFNDVAIAHLLLDASGAAGIGGSQTAATVGLACHLHDTGIHVLQIFWGAWLVPLASLARRSRLVPRFVAMWLGVNGIAYLALSVTGLALPRLQEAVSLLAVPAQLGEVAFTVGLLWLGMRTPRLAPVLARA